MRTIHLVTADESLLASGRAAASALKGWSFAHVRSAEELRAKPAKPGDVLLLDSQLKTANVYELCRSLTGQTRSRTFIVVDQDNRLADPIAHFCGATGTLPRPLTAANVSRALEVTGGPTPSPAPALASRSMQSPEPVAEALLRGAKGAKGAKGTQEDLLRMALIDPETGLFNYAYLTFKLEEEFKRTTRFGAPLSCVMLGFEGQASAQVLAELTGIFLQTSRDTDVLGRFDENSFLFLLTHTGPDGAQVMAKRVQEMAQEQRLNDLVGDALQISVGIAFHPHPEVHKKEDLFAAARKAFLAARNKGGGVVTCS